MAMVQLYMYAILMRNRTLASDFSFMSFSFSSDLFIHEMGMSNKFRQIYFPVKVQNDRELMLPLAPNYTKTVCKFHWKIKQTFRRMFWHCQVQVHIGVDCYLCHPTTPKHFANFEKFTFFFNETCKLFWNSQVTFVQTTFEHLHCPFDFSIKYVSFQIITS